MRSEENLQTEWRQEPRKARATWVKDNDDVDEYEHVEIEISRIGADFYIDGLREGWFLSLPGESVALKDIDGKPLECDRCGFEPTSVAQLRACSECDEILCLNCAAVDE